MQIYIYVNSSVSSHVLALTPLLFTTYKQAQKLFRQCCMNCPVVWKGEHMGKLGHQRASEPSCCSSR